MPVDLEEFKLPPRSFSPRGQARLNPECSRTIRRNGLVRTTRKIYWIRPRRRSEDVPPEAAWHPRVPDSILHGVKLACYSAHRPCQSKRWRRGVESTRESSTASLRRFFSAGKEILRSQGVPAVSKCTDRVCIGATANLYS